MRRTGAHLDYLWSVLSGGDKLEPVFLWTSEERGPPWQRRSPASNWPERLLKAQFLLICFSRSLITKGCKVEGRREITVVFFPLLLYQLASACRAKHTPACKTCMSVFKPKEGCVAALSQLRAQHSHPGLGGPRQSLQMCSSWLPGAKPCLTAPCFKSHGTWSWMPCLFFLMGSGAMTPPHSVEFIVCHITQAW